MHTYIYLLTCFYIRNSNECTYTVYTKNLSFLKWKVFSRKGRVNDDRIKSSNIIERTQWCYRGSEKDYGHPTTRNLDKNSCGQFTK